MKIQRMKTNRIVNPLGFDLKTPHVSWTVTDTEAKKQLWARVEVSKTEDFADVIFDTGACKTASSLGVPVEIALEPRTRYFWRVTVMGDNGELVTSDTAWFETAKLDEPFTAQRISPCLAPDTAPYMRRAFEIPGEVLSARAYFTGLGIYELYLNGEKANDEYLAPGCTAYDSWIQYQTYDVTDLIHTGENVIGAILGNGWAKGRFGFDGVVGDYETNFPGKPCNMYTEEYLLFGELHVTTTQGETVIVTDESWQCAPNPLTFGNAISLSFGLAPEFAREKITETLRGLLAMNKGKLKTGFLGTPVLCRALSDNGANAEAYTLLLNEENPGWLYEVNMGATTIWERWNSVNPDGKISGIGMNSMNHYAYGAVFEWVYKNVCGLNPVPDVPGYKKAVIRPQPDVRLGAAKAKVNTAAGYYETGWRYEDNGEVTYTVVIPFDAEAEVYLPKKDGTTEEMTLTAGTYTFTL